jgi:cell division septal protein FtsQ
MDLPVRRRAAGRRSRRIRRRSLPISQTRLLAALGAVLVASAAWVVSIDQVFAVDPTRVTIVGASSTDQAAIRADLGLGDASSGGSTALNVFHLTTDEMERRIETLPSVLSASVETSLPNQLVVRVRERQPVMLWHTATATWLVDPSGLVIAADPGGASGQTGLPVIQDLRTSPEQLSAGASLDPLDLKVALQLGAITPSLLGSSASSLSLSVDDEDGWVLAAPQGWRAVFGHFTSELHTPDDIAYQVQCLTSLLADREPNVASVILAGAADRCGTYTSSVAGQAGNGPGASPSPHAHTRPTPSPDSSPEPSSPPKKHNGKVPKSGAGDSPAPDAKPTKKPSR